MSAFFILAGCALVGEDNDKVQTPVVKTSNGLVAGTRQNGVETYLGIQYAAAPVGDLRWRPPAPAQDWSGLKSAEEFGASCIQGEVSGIARQSEDCLYLNIWTPDSTPSEPLPVLVWIHGGGFVVGAGSNPMINGQKLAREENVVVVTFNYRLGLLGFLAHEALSDESQDGSSGAYGLLDQRAAIAWVKDNIEAFGGDPEKLTLGGNSAGAMGVCYHLASPESRNLFQQAIIQSGACWRPTQSHAFNEEQGRRAATRLGCMNADSLLQCMRSKSAESIMVALAPDTPPPGGSLFQATGIGWTPPPYIDGAFLTSPLRRTFTETPVNPMPILIGSTADEGIFFQLSDKTSPDAKIYDLALAQKFGDDARHVREQYPLTRFSSAVEALAKISGDETFHCQTIQTAQALQSSGDKVFLYRFDRPLHTVAAVETAFHTSELPFVFGNDHFLAPLAGEDLAFSADVMAYWGRFIRNGAPSRPGSAQWPSLDSGEMTIFADTMSLEKVSGGGDCAFWRDRWLSAALE